MMYSSGPEEPGVNDVLCGRGASINVHEGNVRFRTVVAGHQQQYIKAKKEEKEGISRTIVDIIHKRGGRFLSKNPFGAWEEVEMKKALLKTSQALREGQKIRSNEASPLATTKKSPKPAPAAKAASDAAAAKPAEAKEPPTPPRPPAKVLTAKAVSESSAVMNGTLTDNDVLCGRGGGTNAFVGNIRFRAVVAEHQPRYLVCKRAEKEIIASEIVDIIRQRGGRFLSKNEMGKWEEVTDKKKCILKCSQALREGMNVRSGVLKSPDRASKFATAMSIETQGSVRLLAPKEDANTLIAKIPTLSRPQLEAVARALLCSGSKDAVAVAVTAMRSAAEN